MAACVVRGTSAEIVVPAAVVVRSSTTPPGSMRASWSARGKESSRRVTPASTSGSSMPCGPPSRSTFTRYVIVSARAVSVP